MKCNEIERQIYPLLENELNVPTSEVVEQHLEKCRHCQQLYLKLKAIDTVLTQSPQVPHPQQLDNQVLNAFYSHHNQNRKQETKVNKSWWQIFTGIFGLNMLPKVTVAIVSLLLVGIVGLAFLLGRLTATNVQVSLSQPLMINSPAVNENKESQEHQEISESSSLMKPTSNPISNNNEVVVIKYIKVPVIKEKEVTRLIYLDKALKEAKSKIPLSANSEKDNLALKSSARKNEILTEANLKGFQIVSEPKPRILKKEETNENQ